MIIRNFASILCASTLISCATLPATDSREVSLSHGELLPVNEVSGPIGELCLPVNQNERSPALIFIGGSAGGLDFARPAAKRACGEGFAALALAYWRYEGLPAALEEIPLEYFDRSIAWLMARPEVDEQRVGLVGYSRGGEGALLVASRNPAIKAVAGIVPSSYVGASIDFSDFFRLQSAWSADGQPLPFATNRPNRPGADWREVMAEQPPASAENARKDFSEILRLPSAEAALIPAEQIAGPVMLVAAGNDSTWASEPMIGFLETRLVEAGFQHEVVSLRYATAEHSFVPDAFDDEVQEDDAAGENAWRAIMAFFKNSLGTQAR